MVWQTLAHAWRPNRKLPAGPQQLRQVLSAKTGAAPEQQCPATMLCADTASGWPPPGNEFESFQEIRPTLHKLAQLRNQVLFQFAMLAGDALHSFSNLLQLNMHLLPQLQYDLQSASKLNPLRLRLLICAVSPQKAWRDCFLASLLARFQSPKPLNRLGNENTC